MESGAAGNSYLDYFPAANQHRRWGVYSTSFGRVRVPARSPYPPDAHPRNHFLSWEKGRTLRTYQLLYISRGEGQFESEFSPMVRVGEGTLCLLFPNVWHRYRPLPAVGWTESWIELEGTQIEDLRKRHLLTPREPVHDVGLVPEIFAALTAAEQFAKAKSPGFQVRIGLLGLQILTHLAWKVAPPGSSGRRAEKMVQQALHLLTSNLEKDLSPAAVARELRTGYSYFRRIFKARTGFSPKQYRLEIRFRSTCDFLRNTDLSIKEISERLHYNSPYHLSADFKRRGGKSPRQWRLNQGGNSAPAAGPSRTTIQNSPIKEAKNLVTPPARKPA